jgi:hypothetical protein
MRSELLLKIIKNNKASGIDEIINEYLKSTVSQMMPLYVKLEEAGVAGENHRPWASNW